MEDTFVTLQVVNSSLRYLSFSVKILECSIGVYAASAPYFRHSIRKGSSELSTIGATIRFGLPSFVQWSQARWIRDAPLRQRAGEAQPLSSGAASVEDELDSPSCSRRGREQRRSSRSGARVSEDAIRGAKKGIQGARAERRGSAGS